ncbi:MAG: hypothetical protein JWL85_786 [Candidatus Saccharibacteria bacterium]|nr:hypothetical protein [Candidatus Saccharibacteria bacterium]
MANNRFFRVLVVALLLLVVGLLIELRLSLRAPTPNTPVTIQEV